VSRPPARAVTFGEGRVYTLDQYGFLDPPEQWGEGFAAGMARLQGIYNGLTKEHRGFISYIRRKFLEEKTLPLLVVACAENNLRLGRLKALFPTGYFRGACRIAGVDFRPVQGRINTAKGCTEHVGCSLLSGSGLENEIADRREFYNDFVNTFNIRIESFPDMMVANMMHLVKKEMFKVAEEDKKDVKVEF